MLNPKTFTVALNVKAIISDIKMKAYLIAQKYPDSEQKTEIEDIGTSNIDMLYRFIQRATTTLIEGLYFATRSIADDGTSKDNSLSRTDSIGIVLVLPFDFSSTSLNAVIEYCHDYFVSTGLFEFLFISDEKEAEKWNQKAMDDLEKIKEYASEKVLPFRRQSSVF
jgi:hypothetical protein